MTTLLPRRLAAEAVGTFALVFAGTGAIVFDDASGGKITHVGVALTFGLIVAVMVYAVGHVSGAHLNPAVSVALWAARKFPRRDVLPYAAAQLAGAFAASALLAAIAPHPTLGATLPQTGWGPSFVLELWLTAALLFVVLSLGGGGPVGPAAGRADRWGGDRARSPVRRADLWGEHEPRPVARPGGDEWPRRTPVGCTSRPAARGLVAVPVCRCVQEPGCLFGDSRG